MSTKRTQPDTSPPPAFNLFGKGFRPFFLLGAVWAAIAIILWVLINRGVLVAPVGIAGTHWHGHEIIHGFATAIIVGFLLTAVSNWTARDTLNGWSLFGLVALWAAGRVVLLPGLDINPWLRFAVDGAFLPISALAMALPTFAAKDKRNYPIPFVILGIWLTNVLWHLGVMGVINPTFPGAALQASLDLVGLVVVIVTGRVIPNFTMNATRVFTITSSKRANQITMAGMVLLMAADLMELDKLPVAIIAGITAAAAIWRSKNWGFKPSLPNPLLWVLHVGHAWLVVALLLRTFAFLIPGNYRIAWIHAMGLGVVGVLTIGMMVRVGLGHTGRKIASTRAMALTFWLMNLAALVRVGFAFATKTPVIPSIDATGAIWAFIFLLYAALFAKILITPRPDGRRG